MLCFLGYALLFKKYLQTCNRRLWQFSFFDESETPQKTVLASLGSYALLDPLLDADTRWRLDQDQVVHKTPILQMRLYY